MDVLSDILRTLALEGTLYFTTELRPPWGVRVPSFARVARFHLAVRGSCWVTVGEGEPEHLETGDLVLIPHGAEHTLSSRPDEPCPTLDEVVREAGFTGRGALVWGGPDSGRATRLVCGHFAFDPAADHPFLAQLPAQVVIRQGEAGGPSRAELEDLFRIIAREVREGRPGSDAVVLRLSEALFIQAVRVWAHGEHRRGLLGALLDRHLGQSLEALHEGPAHRWTLDELARRGGLSRTVFADRFRTLVGLSPMQYLATWRMQLAKGLLGKGGLSMDAVAQKVGYESTPAFSRVFKKITGQTPGAYRRAAAARG